MNKLTGENKEQFDLNKLTERLLESDGPIAEELERTKTELNKKKKSITLIVDDDITNRVIMKTLLEMQGSNVLEAENGREAVDLYKKNRDINLIYMDIMMPVMDGITATKIIRLYEETNNLDRVKIIAVTAYSESRNECIKAGVDKVIIKPIVSAELLSNN